MAGKSVGNEGAEVWILELFKYFEACFRTFESENP